MISASAMDLESLIAQAKKNLRSKEFAIAQADKAYKKEMEKDSTPLVQRCQEKLFNQLEDLKEDVKPFQNILNALSFAKTKHKTLKNFCQSLARDIGNILGKEHLINKMRSKLSTYYAAHLWVEQKDNESFNKDEEQITPNKKRKLELEVARENFFANVKKNMVNPRTGTPVDCHKAVDKAARKCRSQHQSWAGNIPIFGIMLGAKRSLTKCSGVAAASLGQRQSQHQHQQIVPEYFKRFTQYYEKGLENGKAYDLGLSTVELLCVKKLVKSYHTYNNQIQRANDNFNNDIKTWNYRIDKAGYIDEYNRETSDLIREINMESACGNITTSECLETDGICKELQDRECKVSTQAVVCANLSGPDHCKGYITSACKGGNKDDSMYCKNQQDNKIRCEETVKSCERKNIPIGCSKLDEVNCAGKCKNLEAECLRKGKKLAGKACKSAKICLAGVNKCVDQKKRCSKAAYSNIRFKFGRLKGMKDYLSNNACPNIGTRSY